MKIFETFNDFEKPLNESIESVLGSDLDNMMSEISNANIMLSRSNLTDEMKEILKLNLKKVDYSLIQTSLSSIENNLTNLKDFIGDKAVLNMKVELDKSVKKTLINLEDEYHWAKLINSNMLQTIVKFLTEKNIKFRFELKENRYFSFIFNVSLKKETAEFLNNTISIYYDRYPTAIFRKYTWTLFGETSGFKNMETGISKKEFN
jgi:hypothetical protein